ncbi:MAG: tetratricopeptide repeat protein [Bacteroidia bacterium]
MNSRPLILVILCLAVGLTLAIGGQRSAMKAGGSERDSDQPIEMDQEWSASVLLNKKVQELPDADRSRFESVSSALDSLKDSPLQVAGLWKSLASFWLTRQDYLGAALCLDQAVMSDPNSGDYKDAGLYYSSARHSSEAEDSLIQVFCRRRSTELLAKALESQPQDLDLKADWAQALVLSSPAPMQGVQVLMEIIKQEPRHLKAHTHLAKLAIESKQFPKAIQRFKNLLDWYPGLGEAYLGLGEAYYRSGKPDSAVIYLKQYRGLVRDPEIQEQIDSYLNQIQP